VGQDNLETTVLPFAHSGFFHCFDDGQSLTCLQVKNGFIFKADMSDLRGPAVKKLCAEGKAWLTESGGKLI
jgi:hypothetical protein